MYFIYGYDAAMQLARKLEKYKNEEGVILAVPRGGVLMGYYFAKHLNFALDLLMTKKLGHPSHEEYAIGAIGLEDSISEDIEGIPQITLNNKQQESAKLKERY
jgi:putative phosphoribosyl transferase